MNKGPINYQVRRAEIRFTTHRHGPDLNTGRLLVSELAFAVPTDYSNLSKGFLRLFARSVERFEKPVDPSAKVVKQKPWFVYLQGGPGGGCPPPQNVSWTDFVLDKGYQILFLDQRGTGLSSTITAKTLAEKGNPENQAAYLKYFRADSIVRDCEAIRKNLTAEFPEEKKKWTVMGQSFGGFCCVNYLSRFPEGLQEVFTCGGLPPLVKQPDVVYEQTFKTVHRRNMAYYQKYPEDHQSVIDIVWHIDEKTQRKEKISLPSGGNFSVLRLRQIGILFGYHGGLDMVHDMIYRLANDLKYFGDFTRPTLAAFEAMMGFDVAPLYALLHEPCYNQGAASNWSASRVKESLPDFVQPSDGKETILFTGEMVFKDMFEDYDELRSLKETADILAKMNDWPDLYDEAQLAKNEVPVYSATFCDDMYVDFELAQKTASKIKNCKHLITNVMYHNAIRAKYEDLLKQLFVLRDDVID